MRMPKAPPQVQKLFVSTPSQRLLHCLGAGVESVHKDKYLHWEDVRVRNPPADLSHEEWWLAIKLKRGSTRRELPFVDKSGQHFSYSDSGDLYRRLRGIDRDCSGQIEVPFGHGFQEGSGEKYLMSSLIEESITSSQLEGAATTRRIAKEMLRTGRSPRDESEQMILSNYHAMEFLRQHAQEDLSMDILLELHRILTHKTLEEHQIGRLRQPLDRVEVASWDGVVVHTPPHANELDVRMGRLLTFANHDHDGQEIHPFVKAVVLHFMIGYDHPFVDGNGRTARALFYWSMARSDYWLTQYLTISSVIRQAPAQYVRAYVYSETDDRDITYFLYYHLKVMRTAISNLHSYLARKSREMERLWSVLRAPDTTILLNHRQVALLGHLLKNPEQIYVIASHQRSHNVTYQTARTDLIKLTELGFLQASKRGRKLVYRKSTEFESKLGELRNALADAANFR